MTEDHMIHPSLIGLKVEIDQLVPLPNNPRTGNVEAIMESYERFGQLKPIVVRATEDGYLMVMSGNHQLEAARRLGWTHIAVTEMQGDDADAIAFALVDNRFGDFVRWSLTNNGTIGRTEALDLLAATGVATTLGYWGIPI